jgi:hypothetical protein
VCTIQLDGLVIIRVNGKLVKSDMHMFGHWLGIYTSQVKPELWKSENSQRVVIKVQPWCMWETVNKKVTVS